MPLAGLRKESGSLLACLPLVRANGTGRISTHVHVYNNVARSKTELEEYQHMSMFTKTKLGLVDLPLFLYASFYDK